MILIDENDNINVESWIITALSLGASFEESQRMTMRDICIMMEAKEMRERSVWRQNAWIGSLIVAPHSKKKITAMELMPHVFEVEEDNSIFVLEEIDIENREDYIFEVEFKRREQEKQDKISKDLAYFNCEVSDDR